MTAIHNVSHKMIHLLEIKPSLFCHNKMLFEASDFKGFNLELLGANVWSEVRDLKAWVEVSQTLPRVVAVY